MHESPSEMMKRLHRQRKVHEIMSRRDLTAQQKAVALATFSVVEAIKDQVAPHAAAAGKRLVGAIRRRYFN
jgi:hypothetical protein